MDKLNESIILSGSDDLLKKYNTIWDKFLADIKKEFDSKLVYNKIFLKIKVKSSGDEVTNFYDKEILKMESNYTYLAVISLDSALKGDENYYPQIFLKECKYNNKKVIRHIIDDLGSFSDYSEDSDEEQIKAMQLTFFENIFFENVISKKCIFEGAISKMPFFQVAVSKMYFLREKL